MSLVVDSSALVSVFTNARGHPAVARLAAEACHAPHLVDAELGNAFRRLVLQGALAPRQAASALASAARLVDLRYGHQAPLAEAAWALRDNLTFYDALYIALATALELPLLTADRRLAAMPDPPCAIELVA